MAADFIVRSRDGERKEVTTTIQLSENQKTTQLAAVITLMSIHHIFLPEILSNIRWL
jgi:hypothetical protein